MRRRSLVNNYAVQFGGKHSPSPASNQKLREANSLTRGLMTRLVVFALTLPVLLPLQAQTQKTFAWTNVTMPGSGPSARWGHRMVYDSTRSKVILFGGTDDVTLFNDLWEWDPTTQAWTQI